MTHENSETELWTVYDNADDTSIASGSYEEVCASLGLSRGDFDEIVTRFRRGERDFTLLGAKRNINIMVDGYCATRMKVSNDERR